jgi:hypothetical protein
MAKHRALTISNLILNAGPATDLIVSIAGRQLKPKPRSAPKGITSFGNTVTPHSLSVCKADPAGELFYLFRPGVPSAVLIFD